MRLVFLCLLSVVLAGCHRRYIDCRSEYLYPRYLAAERIDTPDPLRKCFYGQQIIVRWRLPRGCLDQPTTLVLKVRYGNREIETLSMPVKTTHGWQIHRLVNQDYWCRGGILAFQAQLLHGDQVLDSWSHSLWAEIIEIIPEN